VEKISFLTRVAEVMKGMLSHKNMMASIRRSCMRGESENLALMRAEEENIDALISGISDICELEIPERVMDVLVLRYLRNTQFLAGIKEDDIDVSELGGDDLNFWKKTMLYKTP
jgi:hypothetical protein